MCAQNDTSGKSRCVKYTREHTSGGVWCLITRRIIARRSRWISAAGAPAARADAQAAMASSIRRAVRRVGMSVKFINPNLK